MKHLTAVFTTGQTVGLGTRMERVETAVVPAAGIGSRMRPYTEFVPKEMLPLGSFPMIEHTIAELVSSGVKRIGVVIRKGKEVIQDYLYKRRRLYEGVEIEFLYQKAPLGLGDALRTAKDFIEGTPFVMALPDQILLSESPATRQLLDAWKGAKGIWSSMVQIPKKEMAFFKGSRCFQTQRRGRRVYLIDDISSAETSPMRGFGRTVFLPEALEYMTEAFANDATGEVDLFRTFHALKNQVPLFGILLRGRPCDLGTWEGYYFYQRSILPYLTLRGNIQ